MKLKARVIESEFLTREFIIDCGKGTQMISWLATTACLRFGQEHYPKGIYIPNLLTKEDTENVPHPRSRIKDCYFDDGDIVIVHLKDRSKKQSFEEEDWYEKAFGSKQNIVTKKIVFKPQYSEQLKKSGKYEVWATIHYTMFPEMEGEFSKTDERYKAKRMVKLDAEEDENNCWEYEKDLEYPWGEFKIEYGYDLKGKKVEDLELKEISPQDKEFLMETQYPKVIKSMVELRQEHAQEEEENKKREQEARLAQKRLEEEKARLRYEQQAQIAKQEANTAQLKVYFEAMNLGFHTGEEDFNASMSVLSIYHQELMDNFKFYSQLQEQKFRKEENYLITLQSFMDFVKLMDIAKTREDATAACECMGEIDDVKPPFADTLNIMNGLNYAQFLEAILRIAYYKKDNSNESGNPDGFKNTLETMFAECDLDLKKRAKNDPVIDQMVSLAKDNFWEENYDLLAAIFNERATIKGNQGDHLELSKPDLVTILKEANILIIQKKEETKGGGKAPPKEENKKEEEEKAPERKFDEQDVHEHIQASFAFDEDQLGYVDFLEALVRIAKVYPFTPEEEAEMVNFEMRMMYFVQKLEDKFKNLKDTFYNKLNARSMEMQFQPKVVVDEEDDDDFDME